ncbi:MAG: hypothetical protein ACRD3N_18900 [Terracidiphilus sp.]
MFNRTSAALLLYFLLFRGCSGPKAAVPRLRYRASGDSPKIIALYEAWFGFSKHIDVGYSSHDPSVVKKQILHAKAMGISAFVVDWYGDREPFIDRSYALMQKMAAKEKFQVAMMYDETEAQVGATDEAIADLTMFHNTYLSPSSPGRVAYLTYEGRPVIFVFPKGGHTNWDEVRAYVNTWNPKPFLIDENLPGAYADAFDGFYAWINPGKEGWAADGSNWGKDYLSNFYQTMREKYPDKMIVGGAWALFDDSKAPWGLNRHISPRCGQTFADTFNFWHSYFPSDDPIPFVMIETWNDYEEGSAIERGIPTCGGSGTEDRLPLSTAGAPSAAHR